ncbi:MAG: hypothetical protein JNM62_09895 [Flavobacteriales bacterium]|nr:hypothetical protein [Flavobacteriales bacterium]
MTLIELMNADSFDMYHEAECKGAVLSADPHLSASSAFQGILVTLFQQAIHTIGPSGTKTYLRGRKCGWFRLQNSTTPSCPSTSER